MSLLLLASSGCLIRVLMEYHQQIEEYLNTRRLSLIFLFRRNLLRRMVSVLANIHDKDTATEWNPQAKVLAKYKPRINVTSLIPEPKQTEETAAKAVEYFKSPRHIVLCFEDLIHN
ncbi:hypothetical protein K1719_015703 [Acacia pycnantha]|nr:hypothetical protein K1719_015703 [Acacia pycnantha]